MSVAVKVRRIDKWSVGYNAAEDLTILKCETAGQPDIVMAFTREHAEQIARAILDQLKKQPPTHAKMN